MEKTREKYFVRNINLNLTMKIKNYAPIIPVVFLPALLKNKPVKHRVTGAAFFCRQVNNIPGIHGNAFYL